MVLMNQVAWVQILVLPFISWMIQMTCLTSLSFRYIICKMGTLTLHGGVVRMEGNSIVHVESLAPCQVWERLSLNIGGLFLPPPSGLSVPWPSQDSWALQQKLSLNVFQRSWAAGCPEGSETWGSWWKAQLPGPTPRDRGGAWKLDSSVVWDVLPGLGPAALDVTVLSDFRLNSLYRLGTLIWKFSSTLAVASFSFLFSFNRLLHHGCFSLLHMHVSFWWSWLP